MEYWTDEKDQALRGYWDQGLTGSQIAQNMRTTRSAILARARRIRCAARVSEDAKASANPRKKRNVTAFNFSEARKSGRDPLANLAKEPYVSRETIVMPPEKRLPLEALEISHCRYPHGETPPYAFCGAKSILGTSWCPAHFHAVTGAPHPSQLSGNSGEFELSENLRELEAAL